MVNSKIISNGIVISVIRLAIIALILYFLYQIQSIFVYLFIALVLTLITNPIVIFFRNKLKFRPTLSVITTLTLVVVTFGNIIMMLAPLIIKQAENLSLLNTNILEKNIANVLNQINTYFAGYDIDIYSLLKELKISSKLNFNFIPIFLNSLIGTLSNIGIGIGAVFFITFFFLKDKDIFVENFKRILPNEHEEKILQSISKTNYLLGRYFIGLILQITILFILYLIVLLIFGVENALIIAFLSAILNIIPYIGPLIASILVCVLTLLGNIGVEPITDILSTILYVLISYSVVQLIDNSIISPIIYSNSINCHPLEIFIVILICGHITGVLGMILAVPIYTALKVITEAFFTKNVITKVLTKEI